MTITSPSPAVGPFFPFDSPVILGADVTLSVTNNNIHFNSTVNGAHSLTISDGTVTTTFSSTIGATTPLNNLTLTGDNVSFGGSIYGTGTFTLAPSTNSTAMHINDGTSSGLYLTATEQGYIHSDWANLVFGKAAETGALTAGASTWGSNATFITGSGLITLSGVEALGSHNLTIQTDTTPTVSATPTGTGTLWVDPASAATTMGVAGGTGSLNIGTGLLTSLGNTWGTYQFGNTAESGNMAVNAYTWGGNLTLMTGSGAITLAGVEAVGANNLTLQSDTTPTISATPTGTGTLWVEPASAATTVGVASGAGSLNIGTALLTNLGNTWSTYQFGNTAENGNMAVNAYTWSGNLTLMTSTGVITIAGAQALGAHNFIMETNATPTFSAGVTTTGSVTVETEGNTLGIGTGATGTVNLSNTALGDLTGGSYTFGSASTGAVDINTAFTFPGAVTFITNGANITLDSNVSSSSSNIAFRDPVLLNTASTVNSGGGNITFGSAIDGAHALTVSNGAGTVTFTGAVGGTTALSTLDVSGSGTIDLYGNITTNNADVTLAGPVLLYGNSAINAGSGTLTFGSTVDSFAGLADVSVLVVGGGGGGGTNGGGGGGGGGVIYDASYAVTANNSLNVIVGAGGAGTTGSLSTGTSGGNSTFGSITALGGGGGASRDGGGAALSGGSGGGGGGSDSGSDATAGSGTAGQGNNGANGTPIDLGVNAAGGGGGGGAGGAGTAGASDQGGTGGNGSSYSISGSSATYGGGGGGGVTVNGTRGMGGTGGGGNGGDGTHAATSGTANLGGGGGGGGPIGAGGAGGAGGSGVVIVSYTGSASQTTVTGGTSTTSGGNTIWTFTGNGSFSTLGCAGGCNLTVNAGSVHFSGAVGGTTALHNLTTTGATTFNGNVTTTGAQTYNSAVTLGGNDALTTTNSGVTFGSTVDGAHSLTVAPGSGRVTYTGAVGGSTALTSLNDSGSGTTVLDASVTTTGAQNYTGAVILGGNATLSTTNSSVTFGSTVDGDGVSGSLTVSDGTGTTSFAGVIGGSAPLANLTLTADNLTFGGNVYGTGTLTIAPSTASTNVHINDGSSSGLYLTGAEQGDIQNDWASVAIGSGSGTGGLTVGSTTWANPLTLLNGNGGITLSGMQTMNGNTFLADTSGNITLGSGTGITSNAAGNAIVVAAGGNFVNNSGSSTPFTASSGRYLGYSNKKANDTNSTTDAPQQVTGYTYGTLAPSAIVPATYNGTQNTWVYDTTSGSITLTALTQNITYGSAPNLVAILGTTYSFACSDGCSSSVLTGGPALAVNDINSLGTSGSGNRNVGAWQIALSGATDNNGYTINYVAGTLNIGKKDLTVTGLTGTVTKTYDGNTTATLAANNYTTKAIALDNVGVSTTAGTYDNKNVGTGKTVTVNGLAINSADAVDYNLVTASVSGAVGEIDARAITITAQANTKTYDATTSAATSATITAGSLAAGDTISLAEVYTNKNAGTNKTLTASGDVASDGNSGNNYTYTYVNNTSGVINKATLTLTAATNTKTYDSTTSAAATPTVSGLQGGDTVTGLAEVYADPNAGTGKTLNVSAYTVNDGNSGNNYTVATVANNTGVINKATLTLTAVTNTKTYDGTTSAAATPTVSGLQGGDSVTGLAEAYASKNAGTNLALSVSAYTVNDGDSGNNYTVSLVGNTTGVINKEALTVTAAANTKTYDGTTSAATAPTITAGSIMAGDTANFRETYASKNAGSSITLTPSGTVTDGNSGNNYTYTFVSANTGTINKEAVTLTAAANTKTYDGTLSAAALPTITAGTLMAGDSASGLAEVYTSRNAGTGLTLTPSGGVADGNGGNNYAYTYVNNTSGVINQAALTITAKDDSMTYADGTLLSGATGFTAAGLAAGDSIGAVTLATNATASSSGNYNVGTWSITPSAAAGGNFLAGNYAITYANAPVGLTVAPKSLTITGMQADSKRYDGTTTAILNNSADQLAGLVSGDSVSFAATATGTFADAAVGSKKTVTAAGFTLSGPDAADYILIPPTALASITDAGEEVAASGVDLTTLTMPFFCSAGTQDGRSAACTATTLAVHPNPMHIFYNIPTNLMLIHEEPMGYGDDSHLR